MRKFLFTILSDLWNAKIRLDEARAAVNRIHFQYVNRLFLCVFLAFLLGVLLSLGQRLPAMFTMLVLSTLIAITISPWD